MILVFVQAVLVIAAGVGLFWLWRLACPSERWLRYVVAAGFLGRALLGQALFWISWARLPIARSMQTGDGLWFFADDAKLYFPAALAAARKGLGAIYAVNPTEPSRIFIQTLSLAVWLVGAVASTAVLLNLFFYLGTVAVITRWPVRDARSRTAAAIAVAAISLSPAFVLWTLQPLKDTYFQFLFVSFIAACAAWQRAWAVPRQRGKRLAIGVMLLVLMFGLSSIRWYFGFALLLAASFFLLLAAFKTKGRKLAPVSAAVAMAFLLSRSLVSGAGVYLPPLLSVALNPTTTFAAARAVPAFLFQGVESARAAFDAAGGRTLIRAGARPPANATVEVTQPAATYPQVPAASPPSSNTPQAAEIRAMLDAEVAAWNRGDFDTVVNGLARTPDVELSNGVRGVRGWQPALNYSKQYCARHAGTTLALSDIRIDEAGGAASVTGRWQWTDAVRSRNGVFFMALRRLQGDGWKAVRLLVPTGPAPLPATAVARTEEGGGEIQKPSSRGARLLTGVAVVVLPRSIGERLGVFHVGGGRGMLWFTEIDTIIFDAALLLALFSVATRFRVALRDPLTWLTLLITLLIGIPLLYTITNFGTLFRLREMIYIGLVLTPLAVATAFPRDEKIVPCG
ncbi:MAG TPA: hypothetical protein VGQ65_06180 [Thermoanaerobaculia bacterium]|jgi:hypothetical protein|nr:hypothetical protein [Thermoanaerobaculia bacterium]